jgi:transcriptional regulator with XRE-family HTH domain
MRRTAPMVHADRIAQLRRQHGLSQRGLGLKLGKDAQYVSKLERGARSVVLSTTLAQLAQALGCSSDYLLNLTDDPRSATPVGKEEAVWTPRTL